MLTRIREFLQTDNPSAQVTRLKKMLAITMIIVVVVIASLNSPGYDWHFWGRPSAQAALAGESPYSIFGFFAPPWALLPLLPLALMPEKIGTVVLTILHFISYIFVAKKLGAKPITIILFMLLPNIALWGFAFANLDWLVILGILLPPQIGIFFVLVKPQIGIGVAVFWLVEAWRIGKIKQVMKTFLPVAIAYLLSFALFGFWPSVYLKVFKQLNTSLWPMALPIGLVMLFSALRSRKMGLAISSSLFLSPYVGIHSWPIAILGLLPQQTETLLAIVGLWVVNIIQNEPLRQLISNTFSGK